MFSTGKLFDQKLCQANDNGSSRQVLMATSDTLAGPRHGSTLAAFLGSGSGSQALGTESRLTSRHSWQSRLLANYISQNILAKVAEISILLQLLSKEGHAVDTVRVHSFNCNNCAA